MALGGLMVLSALFASTTLAAHAAAPAAPVTVSAAPSVHVVPTPVSERSLPSQVAPPFPNAPGFYPPISPSVVAIANCTTAPVIPGCGYYKEAAPMGIADYGVSGYGNPTPYTYSTTEFVGTFNWNEAYFYNSSLTGEAADFTVQLNVVLNFQAGAGSGQNYSYWIQDVAVPSDSTKNTLDMSYENNIWNFSAALQGSSTYVPIPSGTLSGNGSVQGTEYYYDGASGTGSSDKLTDSQFQLIVISTLTSTGRPLVRFCYLDPTMASMVCYDSVTFSSAKILDHNNNFLVTGYSMNPTGLFEDAELTIGGPGGGTYTKNTGPTIAATSLSYWNGHNMEATPTAFNMGDDTAESTTADQAIYSQDGWGTPLTTHLNGTTRDDALKMDYSKPMVGTLAAWDTGTSGTVAVGAKDWTYTDGWASLVLVPGTYPVWINVTGGASNAMGMCTITANTVLNITAGTPCSGTGSGLTVGTPTASPHSSADVGQTVTFSSAVSGGTSPYAYTWTVTPSSGLGCGSLTGSSLSCVPTNSNSYTVALSVTDSASHTAMGTLTGFLVHPDPTVAVPVATPASGQVGTALSIASSLGLAGAGSDTYAWTYSPATGLGCAASTSTSVSCTPTAVGTYTATLTVTDADGGTGANTSASISVTAVQPVVTTPTAAPTSVDIGQSVTFTSTVTNPGSGGDTYTWAISPSSGLGCTASTSTTMTCSPTTAASYSITFTAKDNSGHSGTATLTGFQVFADPAIGNPTGNPAVVDVTQSVTFTVPVTAAGATPDSFVWTTSAGLGCPSGSTGTLSCAPTAAGTFTVSVTMTDANGLHSTGTSSYLVNSKPVVTQPTPSPAAVAVGGTVTFTSVLTSPGTSPDTFSWTESATTGSGTGLGCTTSTSLSLTCTPTAAGTYTVTITVSDGALETASATSTSMTVAPASTSPLTATATANQTTGPAPLSVSFTGTGSGGSPSYTYTWRFDDGNSAVGQTVPHTFSTKGTYVVWLWVNDSGGHSASATLTITVQSSGSASPNSTSGSFLGNYWWLLLLIAAVAVAAIVGVAYSRRRRPEEQLGGYDGMAPEPMMAAGAVGGAAMYGATAPVAAGAPPPSSDGPGSSYIAEPAPEPSPAPAPVAAVSPGPAAVADAGPVVAPGPSPESAPSAEVAPSPAVATSPEVAPAPAPMAAPVPTPAPAPAPVAAPPPARSPTAPPPPDSDKSTDEVAPDPNNWVARPSQRPPPVRKPAGK